MSMSLLCNGNVSPSRLVKLDTTQVGGYVIQCVGSDRPIGVAQEGTRQAPLSGLDDGYVGIAGVNEIVVYTTNDVCWIEIGGAVTTGDYLKPNSSGQGVTSSSSGDQYGAIALESGTAAGQYVKCRVAIGYHQ